MVSLLVFVMGLALASQAMIGLAFLISCFSEHEKRASVFAGIQLLFMLLILGLFIWLERSDVFSTDFGQASLAIAIGAGIFGVFLVVRKTAPNDKALQGTQGLIMGEVKRYDEREMISVRNKLRPGTTYYNQFYQLFPQHKLYDDKRREIGGAMGPRAGFIDRPLESPNVAATLACDILPLYLSTPEIAKPAIDPDLGDKKIQLSPEEATERVKGFAKYLGADLVGITKINPLWIYSHRGSINHGNWEDWGDEIPIEHQYAIVFATEMSFEMISTAPHTPTTIESLSGYAKGAYIATQLAAFIANLGYSATQNRSSYYEASVVPLAVDAGLGEVSRLGYLVTKELGPRVRLAAVTTNLPLITDKPVDIGIEDFCKVCKKCATCCPSKSISDGDQEIWKGIFRWKFSAETCFNYWGKIGTDCNVCMRVCPWSHARTLPHKFIVALVARNKIARRLFILLDDIFYGKRPKPKAPPKWAQYESLT